VNISNVFPIKQYSPKAVLENHIINAKLVIMGNVRKFVIGDIHSHYDEFIEVLDRAGFQYDNDLLISLGDLVDRGPKPIEVVEKVMQIKNFIHILGNHDEWCYQFLKYDYKPYIWTSQGGMSTVNAYSKKPEMIKKHREFFEKAKLYHIDEESRLFVHGGYNWEIPFKEQSHDKELLIWDRSLFSKAIEYDQSGKTFDEFKEIFIGHTPTQHIGSTVPKKLSNLWMLDTGIYLFGKLTIMNIETKEYWQSNPG
jgi:serine/threonine protein phosphatase 1